jgi:uncharacterized membrane protein YqjE
MSTVTESRHQPLRADRERTHHDHRADAGHHGAPAETPPTAEHRATHPHTHHESRPLSSLLRELRDEALTLVQKEFQLARVEMTEKVDEAQNAVATSIGGAALLLAGLFTLCMAVAAGVYAAMIAADIAPAISLWAAPLVVGALIALIGYAMVNRAKKVTRAEHWRPERTQRSVRETRDWAERKM